MRTLFDKTVLAGLKLKNRIFRSATWVGLCEPDGTPKDEVYDIYRELAAGETGVIFTELTDVSRWNTSMGDNMRLYSDELIPVYKKLVDIVHEYDAIVMPQLNIDEYARSEGAHETVAVDDLTEADIADIKRLFVEAAVRSAECCFDGVQLHLAYGWLLSRFLDPRYNHRTDAYGGDAAGRARIVCEIVAEIKERVPSMPLCAKFTFYPGVDFRNADRRAFRSAKVDEVGISNIFDIEDCSEICRLLQEAGMDFIEVLGDHSIFERGNKHSSCYRDIAKAVMAKCSMPIVLTGTHMDVDEMEEILNEDGTPYFGISRPLIREPELPKMWRLGIKKDSACLHCDGCYRTYGKRCVFTK